MMSIKTFPLLSSSTSFSCHTNIFTNRCCFSSFSFASSSSVTSASICSPTKTSSFSVPLFNLSWQRRFFGSQGVVVREVRNLAVMGAGQMGTGIALTAAHKLTSQQKEGENGNEKGGRECFVNVLDVSKTQLEKSRKYISSWIAKEEAKNRLNKEDGKRILNSIQFIPFSFTEEGGGVEGEETNFSWESVDFVIEAASENLSLKLRLFELLDSLTRPDVILASNTSSISITKIGGVTSKPSNVIGMHFMNPVPVMPLVEVITGLSTNDDTLKTTEMLAKAMGKVTAKSADRPGFIANRILMPYINEATFALQEGVATREDIDIILKLGTNVPMGPLTLADFIGLDTCLAIMKVLHKELGEDKYRPSPLLSQYVDAGFLGKKVGRGFYEYKK